MSALASATRQSVVSRNLGFRSASIAVANEISKGLLSAWGERLQILIELPLFAVFFLLLALILGRGPQIAGGHLDWRFDALQVSTLFVGFAAYTFWYLQTAKLFWRLLGEIQSGTLEQVYLSPLPAWLVAAAGRVLATVLETAFIVGIMSAIVYVVVPFHLYWRWQALIPIALVAAGSVGYSLLEGGLTLIWKTDPDLEEGRDDPRARTRTDGVLERSFAPAGSVARLDGGHRKVHTDKPGSRRPPGINGARQRVDSGKRRRQH